MSDYEKSDISPTNEHDLKRIDSSEIEDHFGLVTHLLTDVVSERLTEEQSKELDRLHADSIKALEANDNKRFNEISEEIQDFNAAEIITLKNLTVLDGTLEFGSKRQENNPTNVDWSMARLFQENQELRNEYLDMVRDNPNLRVVLLRAHGGDTRYLDSNNHDFHDNEWLCWDKDNKPRRMSDLITYLDDKADVLLIESCNIADISVESKTMTIFWNKGNLSLSSKEEGDKSDLHVHRPSQK